MSVDELTELITEEEEPKRPRVVFIAIFTLVVLGAVVALLFMAQGNTQPLAELRIRETNVDVRSGTSEYGQGVEGQALAFGDTVRTDGSGQAQVDYFDGSLTRLDAETTFVIRELEQGNGTKRITVRQDAGRTWNRVESLSSSQDRFELHSVSAVATVRGTAWVMDSRQAPVEYALVVSGQIEVTVPNVGTATVKEDECVRIEPGEIRPCTQHEQETLKDEWYFQNYFYEGGNPDVSPGAFATPEPTGSPDTGAIVPRRRSSSGTGGTGGSGGGTAATAKPPTPKPPPPRGSIDDHDKEETHDDDDDDDRDNDRDPPTNPDPPPEEPPAEDPPPADPPPPTSE